MNVPTVEFYNFVCMKQLQILLRRKQFRAAYSLIEELFYVYRGDKPLALC